MCLSKNLCYTLLLLVYIVLNVGCNKKPISVPEASTITKADRERLGGIFLEYIKEHEDAYPILPNIGVDTLAYQFIQTLYNQATATIHLDLNASVSNRWERERTWEVYILDKQEEQAFILPGGAFFISKGFLEKLQYEYELYFILAFEANVMNEMHLIHNMITNYNTINIRNIINGMSESGGFSKSKMAEDIINLSLTEETILALDPLTLHTICNTSLYRPDGINTILTNLSDNDWLRKRPSYAGRYDRIENIKENDADCGSLSTTGAYEENVLNTFN